jgi:hypothetical protein
VDKLCIEEEGRLRKIEYPQLKISSELLCGWLEIAVDLNRPEWEQDQERKAFQKKKKEDTRITAQRTKAAALEEEAHKSSVRGRFGLFRNPTGCLRSERHRKPEEDSKSLPGLEMGLPKRVCLGQTQESSLEIMSCLRDRHLGGRRVQLVEKRAARSQVQSGTQCLCSKSRVSSFCSLGSSPVHLRWVFDRLRVV